MDKINVSILRKTFPFTCIIIRKPYLQTYEVTHIFVFIIIQGIIYQDSHRTLLYKLATLAMQI